MACRIIAISLMSGNSPFRTEPMALFTPSIHPSNRARERAAELWIVVSPDRVLFRVGPEMLCGFAAAYDVSLPMCSLS